MNKIINNVAFSIFILMVICRISIFSQNTDDTVSWKIKNIPYSLQKLNDPMNIAITGDSVLTILARERTNLFNSPGGNFYVQNAPMLLFRPDSNFVLKAKVTADLKEVYDVAALVIYHDKDLWAKLCFENSANKEALVVSVVTRKYSDDCNSFRLSNNYVYLAISKKGNEFSFHYSEDNVNWEMVRQFKLEFPNDNIMVGFAAHCAVSKEFSADFSEIQYSDTALKNMRKYN